MSALCVGGVISLKTSIKVLSSSGREAATLELMRNNPRVSVTVECFIITLLTHSFDTDVIGFICQMGFIFCTITVSVASEC